MPASIEEFNKAKCMYGINSVQVLSYGFLAVMTLHGIRLDSPQLYMAHQRSPGTPMPWLV